MTINNIEQAIELCDDITNCSIRLEQILDSIKKFELNYKLKDVNIRIKDILQHLLHLQHLEIKKKIQEQAKGGLSIFDKKRIKIKR